MSLADFDIGPLSWVKGEIDAALNKAKEHIALFAGNPAETAPLKFAQTHLHQVKGAVQMVGLDGLARFAEEVEQFVAALESGALAGDGDNLDRLDAALNALSRYLDDLMAGSRDVPLKLFPLYRQLLEARGVERVNEADLFFPDLGVRAPKGVEASPMGEAELTRFLRSQRTKYQKGLLGFLRAQDPAGLVGMREALAAIESTQTQPATRTFWWTAVALVDALLHGGVAPTFGVKSLCGRIDQQIRRVVERSTKVAEKLARDVLYHVAVAKPATERLREVQQAFELESYLPPPAAATGAAEERLERMKPTLRELAELLAAAKESWLKFTAGNKDVLKIFQDHASRAAAKGRGLEHAALAALLDQIAAAAAAVSAGESGVADNVSMEMATALLLAENAVEHFARLTDEFDHQAAVQGRRLAAVMRGESLEGIESVPLLDEMSRKAQEKLLLNQVGTEIQSNLRHIEQVLDAFFRDHSKRADIGGLGSYIKQIFGALQILELERAADLLNACQALITQFADPAYQPQQRDMELVAEGLSSLGFYVEAVQHGRPDAFEIIAPVIKTFPGIRNRELREADAVPAATSALAEVPLATVEGGIEEQKREVQSLYTAWRAAPSADARGALQAQLMTLGQDADLIDDALLKARVSRVLSLLEAAGDGASEALDAAVAELTAPKVAAVAPSAETARLLTASSEAIDRELLETYLEEAQDVLATVREHLALVSRRPHDHDALTTIRRSFHTLKGSGRMVGLTDLGEVAWGIEQTMNKWLQEEKDATPELLAMLQHAHDAFAGWVETLNRDGTVAVDASALLAEAEALREEPQGPFDLSAQREALLASRAAASAEAAPDTAGLKRATDVAPAPEVEDIHFESSPSGAGEDITLDASVEDAAEEELVLEWDEAPADSGEPPADVATPAEEAGSGAEAGSDTSAEAAPAPIESAPVEAVIETLPPASNEIHVGELAVNPQLYELFVAESGLHVTTLRQQLAQFEAGSGAPIAHDFLRAAHTLAGISSTVGFKPVADLAYALERCLQDLMAFPRPVDPAATAAFAEAVATLEGMVQAVGRREAPQPAPALEARLAQWVTDARAQREQAETESLEVPAAPAEEPGPMAEPAPAPPEVENQPPAAGRAPVVGTALPKVELDSTIQDDLDPQLLPVFLEEAQELMPQIGSQLRAWRANPTDEASSQGLRRALHTLKGSARMAGAMRLGELTHRMETKVVSAVEGGVPGTRLFDELDDYFDTIGRLHDVLVHGERAEASAAAAAPVAPVVLGVQPQAALPDAALLADMEQAAARALLRVRADIIDRLVNEAGEVSIARSRIEGEMRAFKQSLKDLTENVIRLRNQLREIEIQAETQMQSRLSAAQDSARDFDPLEFDRFTRLQELTRMMAESVNDVSTVQSNMLKDLDEVEAALVAQNRLNRELQQGLMRIRMVPIGSISERLHRIVRQTAKDLDKRATLIIEGENVELDRSVLEKMTAPFEHLLRNAVAHGIEPTAVRAAASKPEVGTIELKARQEGNEVVLVIRDDGGGIDLDRVRAKAIALGLAAPNEDIPPARLTEMIFQPGFSTAENVTQVAGRGVGMDVVRSEIAGLGGRIEVASDKGQGTTFTIYLPLTLAVTQVVIVRAGERLYALPSSMVEQVQELKPAALAEVYQAGRVEWLGNTYPLHYLPRLLGDDAATPEAKPYTSVMLLRSGSQRAAIHVDSLQGNQEVVVKNIGPQLARVSGISGATVLGTGQIVLIINPVQLAHREAPHATGMPTMPAAVVEPVSAPLIMVVDDSLTVRKITGRLLSKEGYQVVTAKDGVDALQQLQTTLPAVMLVDIEMPRMDGFELTKNVRGDARTAHIPIIMITSRTAEKHRNYAMELGVNVYLGKPYQEDELLGHIARFVGRAAAVAA